MSGVRRALTCDEVRDLAAGFVLDALEAGEMDAVRAHLADCTDLHAEIAELASGLPALWETVAPVEPPATLKSRLLAAAAADLPTVAAGRSDQGSVVEGSAPGGARAVAVPSAVAVPTTAGRGMVAGEGRPTPITEYGARHATRGAGRRPSNPAAGAIGRPARSRTRLGWAALGLAAVIAIAVLGAWNVVLQGQIGTLRTGQDALAAVVRAGGTPGSLTAVVAAPQAGGPLGLAALTADGTLVLAMRDLPPTAGAQVYQAWVIVPGGTPAPTGSFQVGDAGTGAIAAAAPVAPGAVVAITLEPGPGATTPTLPILASGKAPTPTN
jgi:anti-sigma-K factor RskA